MSKTYHLSQSIEDYLKTIYDLSRDSELVSTNQIADQLTIAPASVTSMIKKMSSMEPPLVEYRKHHGVKLSPSGQQEALRVVRQHRLLELFLVQVMGYAWDEVHEEAHHLEHVISQKFVDKMATLLNYPTYDPHGDPIPDAELNLPVDNSIALNQMAQGQSGTICRIIHDNNNLLKYLQEHGLTINTQFKLVENNLIDGTIKIEVNNTEIILGPIFGENIYVNHES